MALFVELVSSIALLLWGLRLVRTGVMRAYGARLKHYARSAEGRIAPAFLSGLLVAILLQSSTATAMIVASFSGQGILSVGGAFVSILGADLGTAIAVLVASQKITWISPALISIGVFGFLSTEISRKRSLFRAVLGLGLILLALSMIGQIGLGLSRQQDFVTVMRVFVSQPFLMVLLGIVLTYLAHSSLAIILLVVGFVQSAFLGIESGIYLVLGANIGSGLLPVVANWNSKKNARLPVTANLMVRVLGVAIAFPFASFFVALVGHQIPLSFAPAAFHLVLNLGVVVIALVLMPFLLKAADLIVPVDANDSESVEPKHLDDDALTSPNQALACAKREALNMADIAQAMVRKVLPVLEDDNEELRQEIINQDDTVDRLFDAIKIYIAQTMQQQLTEDESQRAIDLLSFTANMEHIGDIVDGSLMDLAAKKSKLQLRFSDEGLHEIAQMHEVVCSTFDLAINTFVTHDGELARLLYEEKANVRKIESKSVSTHLERIGTGVSDSLQTSSIHLDIVRDLKRINSHLTSIAYPVLKASGKIPRTKWKSA